MAESNASKTNPETPQPRSPSAGRRVAWAVGILLILAALGFLFHRGTAAPAAATGRRAAPPPVTVSVATARKGDIGVYVNGLGAVTPVKTVMVKSRVDGQLMTVYYQEGQMVKTGDPLVEIDPRPFEAQLTEAQGQLVRDQALLENARLDLERYTQAVRRNAVPKQQLDTQQATVHQYEGTVKYDQGQVDAAQLQLVYAHITAPSSGRVGLRLVDPGNIVHATDTNPLAVITQLQPITVIFSLSEDYLPEIEPQIRAGHKMEVQALDRAQQKVLSEGTLLTIDNQIDPSTGTFKLRAIFDNPDNALFPNQFVNARLLVNTEHNAILVPTVAIQRNAQGAFVYLVETNQTITLHPVVVGTTDNDVAAVTGLQPGEAIAADNFNRLQEGTRVTVRQVAAAKLSDVEKTTNLAAAKSPRP